ncbi:hypothetical protein J1614_003883, partial [Plenodomus biglobosus]
ATLPCKHQIYCSTINIFSRQVRDCMAPITSPNCCVPTDQLNHVASIAIDLYPGIKEVSDIFKADVGSNMCNSGITSSACQGAGAGNIASSVDTATPTATYYIV